MNQEERKNWEEWFRVHPEWIGVLVKFFNGRPSLAFAGQFWHDLINVLLPFHMRQQLKDIVRK